MFSKKLIASLVGSTLATLIAATALNASAQVPTGYPADYAKVIEGAKKEGKLVIYSATDSKAAEPLIKDFSALYPGVKVEYNDMNSTEVYNRFISEAAAGGATADLLWSSAMDLQMKLVSDGYGLAYKSPEAGAIPAWADWKHMAYGTTFEPVGFVYNKRLVPADEVPTSHEEFAKLISSKADKYKNKVTTYDIEKSGVGFAFITQDAIDNPKFWTLAKALGDAGVRVQSSTGTMLATGLVWKVAPRSSERNAEMFAATRLAPARNGGSPPEPTARSMSPPPSAPTPKACPRGIASGTPRYAGRRRYGS